MSPAGSLSGDTQPISQSAYDDILKKGYLAEESEEFISTNAIEGTESGITQKTLGEGDTGHLDLLLDFDDGNGNLLPEESDHDATNIEDQDIDMGVSSPSRYQPFPESQRFLDRTPAMRGDRNQPGNTPNTTPSISHNPFSQTNKTPGSIMRLSQVFNATQAASSPANMPRFDLSSDMPSPNIPIQRRINATSALSPIPMSSPEPPFDFAEPEANYVSVKESQAEREKQVSSRKSHSSPVVSDDEFGQADSFLQRRLRERHAENEARKQLAGITAPPRTHSRTAIRKGSSFLPQLPSEVGHQAETALQQVEGERENIETRSHHGPEDESEIETEQEDEDALVYVRNSQRLQNSGEEDKENMDSGPMQAITTAASAHDALSQALEFEQSPSIRQNDYIENSQSSREPATLKQLTLPHECHQSPEIEEDHPHNDIPTAATGDENIIPNDPRGEPNIAEQQANYEIPSPSHNQENIPSSPPRHNVTSPPKPNDIQNDKNGESHPKVPQSSFPQVSNSLPFSGELVNSGTLSGGNENEDANKSLSRLSRILETPAQNQIMERNSLKSIPETSPSNQKIASSTPLAGNSGIDHDNPASDLMDEDKLPIQPPLRAPGQIKPFNSPSLSKGLMAHRFSTILSSPSGRQRRKMTDIASDESPRAAVSEVPLEDIELVTADDHAFQSTVLGPNDHSTKIRRGNDSKRIRVSTRSYGRNLTSALAASRTRVAIPPKEITDSSEQTRLPMEAQEPTVEPEKPHSREEPASIWDLEASPQKPTQGTKPSSSTAGKRGRPRKTNRVGGTQGHEVEAVVIYNSSSSPVPTDRISSSASFPSVQSDRSNSLIFSDFETERSKDQIVAANHVFAFFNGRPHGYYPANCVGPSGISSESRYKVYFEDSDDPVEVDGVKSLDLRVNDLVKVNLPKVPKVPHIVIGFKNRLIPRKDSDGETSRLDKISTDIYGYTTVVIQRKLNDVLPKGQLPRSFSVPISSVYLDKSLWSRLGDRSYKFDSNSIRPASMVPSAMELSMMSRTQRTSYVSHENSGIFSGMAFAISYSGNEKKGSGVKALLSKNGARVLESGFDELFDSSSWSLSAAVTGRNNTPQQNSDAQPLQLTAKGSQIGFVCLITDQHSRRAKYMQALALNLPCLAGQWVHDCVAKQEVIDWEPYLLPAGMSVFLGGAVKSRMLTLYPATNARITDVVSGRPKLLTGQSILFVTGRGEVAQQRKAYAFLTSSLCPKMVHPVQTLQAAVDTCARDLTKIDQSDSQSQKLWDWIYVGDESAAITTRKLLLKVSDSLKQPSGRKRGRQGKAREQSAGISGQDTGSIVINGHTIRILDNEFLCQILILGKLFDR